MLEQGNIIKLSDNQEYIVVDIINLAEKKYVYLMGTANNENFIFAQYENDEIIKETDPKILEQLIYHFNKRLHNPENLKKIF